MMCGEGSCGEYEGRSFLTAEERVKKLEGYRDWLANEKQGVEEAIQRLRKAK